MQKVILQYLEIPGFDETNTQTQENMARFI